MLPPITYAVTGTNGKTSVTHFLLQFWDDRSALAGNLGLISKPAELVYKEGYVVSRQGFLDLMQTVREAKIEKFVFEAFFYLMRDDIIPEGVDLNGAAFTNLTKDHLGQRSNMNFYFACKRKLFTHYLPQEKYKVIYADCPYGQKLLTTLEGKNCVRYGTSSAYDLRYDEKNIYFENRTFARNDLPFFGDHMVQNLLCSIGLALIDGISADHILERIPTLTLAKGRQEKIYDGDFKVFVDFAHNPDAIKVTLETFRTITRNRLIVVMDLNGYVGMRRPEVRADMAKMAYDYADVVLINHEEQDPEIQKDIVEACPKALEFRYREDAVRYAVWNADPGDVIVLAAVGPERSVHFQGRQVPYDEYTAVEKALRMRERLERWR